MYSKQKRKQGEVKKHKIFIKTYMFTTITYVASNQKYILLGK